MNDSSTSLPIVAIVGRPNVGKSSLLNMLARRRIAIVHPTSGVTRDRVSTVISDEGTSFEAWDTGGMGMTDNQALEQEVEAQIQMALDGADVILFVVDAQRGFQEADHPIANKLRLISKPVVLVANKVDGRSQELLLPELHRLGLGEPIAVSAMHGSGRSALLERLAELLPEYAPPQADKELSLAVVGRQNVGKSTLVNCLAKEKRMIVSVIPGTTRDSVDVRFVWNGKRYLIIDTAGMKRRTKVRGDIEYYSAHRAQRSIRRADVTLLMLDASVEIGHIDKQIASYIEEEGKPCVILVNKWDLAKDIDSADFTKYLNDRLHGLAYAPLLFLSAKEGKNVREILELARALHEQSDMRIGTGELNRVLQEASSANPPTLKGSGHARMFYATQVGTHPPNFVVFVNHIEAFGDSYRRFLSGYLRRRFGFKEVPLRITFRERQHEPLRAKEPQSYGARSRNRARGRSPSGRSSSGRSSTGRGPARGGRKKRGTRGR